MTCLRAILCPEIVKGRERVLYGKHYGSETHNDAYNNFNYFKDGNPFCSAGLQGAVHLQTN